MRASEFLGEATLPDQPPSPGTPEFEKSKAYIFRLIKDGIEKYNRYLTTTKTSNPKIYAQLIQNPNNIISGLKSSIMQNLTAGGSGFLTSDYENTLFNSLNLVVPGSTIPPTAASATNIKPPEAAEPENDTPFEPPTDYEIITPQGLKVRYTGTAWGVVDPKTNEVGKTLPNTSPAAQMFIAQAQQEISNKKPAKEDINEGVIIWNADIPSINLSDEDTNDLAQIATEIWYQNRYIKAQNIRKQQSSQAVDPLIGMFAKMFDINPNDKVQIAARMADELQNPEKAKIIADKINRSINR